MEASLQAKGDLKKEEVLVSVLITVFNREEYIAEAIESVLASTFKKFELIIVDDCSTDNSVTIINSYLAIDSRIKFYQNQTNLGQFANRNKAIELSIGEYVKFLDSDDKLVPNGLFIMINSMLKFRDAGLGLPAKVNYNNKLPYQLTQHESILSHYNGENHLCIGPTGSIFKREALLKAGLYEAQYGILADTLLNIKIASLYETVFFTRDLFFWRTHNEQVTVEQLNKVRMIRERYLIMYASMLYEFLPLSKNEIKSILNNFVKINIFHFIHYMLIGHFKDAFQIKNDTNLTFKKVLCALFIS